MKKLLLVLLAACGSGVSSDTPASFDAELPAFKETICRAGAQCFGDNEADCLQDVTQDMADAKAQLDDAGEQRCANCMDVKTREIQRILDASCDTNAADTDAIFDACDLDPNDGVMKDDEACAGFP